MNERTDNNAKTTAVPSDSAPVRAFVETEVFERARRGGEAPPLPNRPRPDRATNGANGRRNNDGESPAAARGQPAGFPGAGDPDRPGDHQLSDRRTPALRL